MTDSVVENDSVATRHIYEFQFGILLQLIYALTGEHITPVSVRSPTNRNRHPIYLKFSLQCSYNFVNPL